MVKHILKKYGYPLDKQQKATGTTLYQAKLLCKDWQKPKTKLLRHVKQLNSC